VQKLSLSGGKMEALCSNGGKCGKIAEKFDFVNFEYKFEKKKLRELPHFAYMYLPHCGTFSKSLPWFDQLEEL
jgi:hypothetical protein